MVTWDVSPFVLCSGPEEPEGFGCPCCSKDVVQGVPFLVSPLEVWGGGREGESKSRIVNQDF